MDEDTALKAAAGLYPVKGSIPFLSAKRKALMELISVNYYDEWRGIMDQRRHVCVWNSTDRSTYISNPTELGGPDRLPDSWEIAF